MAVSSQQFCVRWNSYHSNLQAVFPRLLTTEHFADVTLACETQQIKCHKLVLSACSAYFETLLVQNPCKHPIVFLKDMRFAELHALVDFMYKGEVNVTQDELPSLLKSAEALQIRGLCSAETQSLLSDLLPKPEEEPPEFLKDDFQVASEALAQYANSIPPRTPYPPAATNGSTPKKRRKSLEIDRPSTSAHIKEETVEEDGHYYGEIDNENDYNEDEDTPRKPAKTLTQPGAYPLIRVKPESELFNSHTRRENNYKQIPNINPLNYNYNKYLYNYNDKPQIPDKSVSNAENDYYKLWLEQNGELEVSLLRAGDNVRKPKVFPKNEVELIPKINTKSVEKILPVDVVNALNVDVNSKITQVRRRGRPPIFKEKNAEISETVLKSDLDQFLEGKEVSSSGLSRKDLERVMMGKYNPNRRYSNEAMWAALMDVKRGGSIYRAAQTHKVPRKSLRNWMKRCQIKSSFPMPQQLKQFVENSKKQKEYRNLDGQPSTYDNLPRLEDEEFGKHFLMSNIVSSEDETSGNANDIEKRNDDIIPIEESSNMSIGNE